MEPIYTPDQVRVGIARHPLNWAGRTVRVRGRITHVSDHYLNSHKK